MKSTLFLFGCAVLFLLAGCQKEETPSDPKISPDLLGEWVLQQTTINGITDLAAPLNDHFLILEEDEMGDDLTGKFRSYSPWHETTGTFELRETEQVLVFFYSDKERIRTYWGNGNTLVLTYDEEGDIYEESWLRVE